MVPAPLTLCFIRTCLPSDLSHPAIFWSFKPISSAPCCKLWYMSAIYLIKWLEIYLIVNFCRVLDESMSKWARYVHWTLALTEPSIFRHVLVDGSSRLFRQLILNWLLFNQWELVMSFAAVFAEFVCVEKKLFKYQSSHLEGLYFWEK